MRLLLGLIVALPYAVQAQVYKCQEGGRTVYSQAPCAEGGTLLDRSRAPQPVQGQPSRPGRLHPDVERALRSGNSNPASAQNTAQPASATATCPSDVDIKNIETSGTSILLDRFDQQVWREQARRARACEPLMSEGDMRTMKAKLQAAEPAPERKPRGKNQPMVSSCDPGGCWDTNGRRYNRAAGGTFYRDDGAYCLRIGSQLQCQ